MDNINRLRELLTDKQIIPSDDWIEEMREKYPYFVTPLILELERKNADVAHRNALLSNVALMAADRVALSKILSDDAEKFVNFYPPIEQPEQLDTDTTIDKFLDKYGSSDSNEADAIENAIFNPVPDYALTLEDDDSTSLEPKDEQDSIINSFLAKGTAQILPDTTPVPPPMPVEYLEEQEEQEEVVEVSAAISKPTFEESATLSESLANVYIKQKKYAKAYDILDEISRKFPERNVHIADQLRFLKKLIIIKEYKVG